MNIRGEIYDYRGPKKRKKSLDLVSYIFLRLVNKQVNSKRMYKFKVKNAAANPKDKKSKMVYRVCFFGELNPMEHKLIRDGALIVCNAKYNLFTNRYWIDPTTLRIDNQKIVPKNDL